MNHNDSPQHIAAGIIPAIGRADFPERLLAVYRSLAGCDLCSAFSWDAGRGPRLLFAAGGHPHIPEFALTASRAYAQSYWRLDAVARPEARRDARGLSLVRTAAADIRDAEYRHYCYQRGGVSERLTLLDTDDPVVSVNGYRSVTRGPLSPESVQRMKEAGPILIAAVRRHNELVESAAQADAAPSHAELVQRAREWGLSAREAEVAAALATGRTQPEIARRSGLALTSVITYRRRAYQKLQVSDRRELRALCERLLAPGEPSLRGSAATRRTRRTCASTREF
jgi:DNA-binding CsgD family transcriptional regulator